MQILTKQQNLYVAIYIIKISMLYGGTLLVIVCIGSLGKYL